MTSLRERLGLRSLTPPSADTDVDWLQVGQAIWCSVFEVLTPTCRDK